jgi:uncharacterized membrane protein
MNGKIAQTSPAEPVGTPGKDETPTQANRRITTRQIAIAGICGAIGFVLVLYGGFIPLPNPSGAATTMHIPAIIGGVFAGPVVGALVGLILAISSWAYFGAIFLQMAGGNWLVAICSAFLPRLLIGVLAFYAFRLFSKKALLGAISASLIGTLTNTLGVLGILFLFGDPANRPLILAILALNPFIEIGLAFLVVIPLVVALRKELPDAFSR